MLDLLLKSRKIKEHAFRLLDDGGKSTDDYGHEIYYCCKCSELHTRFHFCIESDIEKYEPEYKCSKCKKVLTRVKLVRSGDKLEIMDIENRAIKWKCPKCGNNELEEDLSVGILRWD